MTEIDQNIWGNDVLCRARFIESFEQFLNSLSDVQMGKPESEQHTTIVALNAPFGSGKTYVLERWYKDLKKRNIPCAYFSAWEHDFSQEPLVAFIHFILNCFDKPKTAQDMVDAENQFLEHGMALAELLGFSNISSYMRFLTKENNETPITLFQKTLNERKQFKNALRSIVNHACQTQGNSPFYLIIDELERCKPTYAVELLEQLKHFLGDVPNLVVVLGIDKEQLKYTIQHHYGQGYDAEGYLKRFFQTFVLLPRIVYNDLKEFKEDIEEKISFDLFRPDFRTLIQYNNDKKLHYEAFASFNQHYLPYTKEFRKFLLLIKASKPTFYYKIMKRVLDEEEFWEEVRTCLNRNDIVDFDDYIDDFKRYFLNIYIFTFKEAPLKNLDAFKTAGADSEAFREEYRKEAEILAHIKPRPHPEQQNETHEALKERTLNLNINTSYRLIVDALNSYLSMRSDFYRHRDIRDALNVILEVHRLPEGGRSARY